MMREFLITSDFGQSQRLDCFLSDRLKGWSRSQVQRLIAEGRALVNGAPKKPGYRLKIHEKVVVDDTPHTFDSLAPENIPLKVIYQDAHLIAIDKPSGMVVHPGAGNRAHTLVSALLHHFPEIEGIGPEEKPGIVHRLDKETSGVILVARTEKAYQELQRQFKARAVTKIYLGLVWGKVSREEGRITWAIGRHMKHGERMSVKTNKPRVAETHYRVIKQLGEVTLLELRPVTGRTHQIRVHLSASGHPVVGDSRYGRKKAGFGDPRLFLHAHRLSVIHPATGKKMTFKSPLPSDLLNFLTKISPHSP